MSGYCCLSGFGIIQVRMHLTGCLKFCLVMVFLLKFLGLKIYFHSSSGLGQLLFLTLELIVKTKKTKTKTKQKKKTRKKKKKKKEEEGN